MTAKELINIDPETMGGTPVFRGTRVPIQHLIDHLESNSTVDEFVEGYPSVTKAQAVAFIHLMSRSVLSERLLLEAT